MDVRSLAMECFRGAAADLQAILTGSLFAAVGVLVFQSAGIIPGGTVGLALLLHEGAGTPLSLALLAANAPFYALACLRMGREFTVKTLAAVVLLSAFVQALPSGIVLAATSPWVGAVLGGLLCGVGMLMLFRHAASLGGLNVAVLFAQRRFGWHPGVLQVVLDAIIVAAGAVLARDASRLAPSVLAVAAINAVLIFNHRVRPRGAASEPAARPQM